MLAYTRFLYIDNVKICDIGFSYISYWYDCDFCLIFRGHFVDFKPCSHKSIAFDEQIIGFIQCVGTLVFCWRHSF